MKLFDVLAASLLVISGLSWGLYGLFDLDLVATTTGSATSLAQFVCAAIGLAALNHVIDLRSTQRRWNVSAVRVN